MSAPVQERLTTLDPAECWNLVERVVAAQSLRRAARLRQFLLFVGTQSLKLGRHDIHEQEIGETVFGRPQSYDTSQDNIVRVSATELRKRVDAYFAGEGKAEPIIFEIPRGSYLPTFRLRDGAAVQSTTLIAMPQPLPEPVASTEQPQPPQMRALLWTISAVALLLAVACILLWRQTVTLYQRLQVLQHQQSITQPASAPHPAAFKPTAQH